MTGPVIPAGLWPEWADRHCWDKDESGRFYGAIPSGNYYGEWHCNAELSEIPMPAGHDWRVPVMRNQPAPAIDLKQFRSAVNAYRNACRKNKEAGDHLLALIDGQANVRSSSEHCSELATDLVTDDAVRRLVRAMENTPGDALLEPNARLCRRLLVAALKPTKGEGE